MKDTLSNTSSSVHTAAGSIDVIQHQTDILDTLLSIAIILFIVSVIVEKITQLIRRYSPFIKHNSTLKKKKIGSYWRNINKKRTDVNSDWDGIIEREVNSLSFVIGLTISVMFRIDLFKMLSTTNDPRDVLFWNGKVEYSPINWIFFPISMALTGFFLTFGSKFFHDLIDTLFQVKNLKRKLVDENTYDSDNIHDFDEHLSKTNSEIIDQVIKHNEGILAHEATIKPPAHGKIKVDGKLVDCIDIHVGSPNRGKIPYSVDYNLTPTKKIRMPVNVVCDVQIAKSQVEQGDSVAHVGSDFKGNICCAVARLGKKGFLTCSHIYTKGYSTNPFGVIDPPKKTQLQGQVLGQFTWGMCNDQLDIAFVEADSSNFTYHLPPSTVRELGPSDILTTEIKVVRRNDIGNPTIEKGTVINYRCKSPTKIGYKDGEFPMVDLIILSKVNDNDDDNRYTTLTKEGDSGSCVYDDQNRPVGMIVAGNEKFSYAISMKLILSKLNATII